MEKKDATFLSDYIRSVIKRPDDWIDPDFIEFQPGKRAKIRKYIEKIINDHIEGNIDNSEKIEAIKCHFSKYKKATLAELRNCIGTDDTIKIERLLRKHNPSSALDETCYFTMILFDIPKPSLPSFHKDPDAIVINEKEQQKQISVVPKSIVPLINDPELSSNLSASKAAFNKVVGNLIRSADFKEDIFELLFELYPSLQKNSNLESDIDFFTTDGENGGLEFAFTAFNFNYKPFDKYQIDRCRKVLNQIKKLEKPVYSFVLVCNTLTNTDEFKSIKAETEELVTMGKAEFASFHDIRSFLEKQITENIDIEIRSKIVESNQQFKDQFQQQMDQHFYVEEIPFFIEPDAQVHKNPVTYLAQSPIQHKNKFLELEYAVRMQRFSRNDSSEKWSFIVSEFGFGKTSLLLNLFKKLDESNILSIFLPLSFFRERSLYTTRDVSKIVLEILFRERDFDYGRNYDQLMSGIMDNMLERRSDLILLFDGLDEHKLAYTPDGLAHLFRATAKLSAECFFTMRKEFWDDKHNNFKMALAPIKKKYQFYSLLEWSESEISKFINEYLEKEHVGETEAARVNEFKELVILNQYSQFYGDIPKRPLFLKMLIADIVSNRIRKRSLAELYEQYLGQKFDIDRIGQFTGETRTSLRMEEMEDRGKVLSRIFYVLEKAAANMFAITSEKECILITSVKESKIEEIKYLKEKEFMVTEILMNSILVPMGKRERGEIELKFAHKSFQEYFFARSIYTVLVESDNAERLAPILHSKLNDSVVTFMKGIIDSKRTKSDEFNYCIYSLSEMNSDDLPSDSLLSHLLNYLSDDIQKLNS
jgi:Predicted NTPase (NACHT family)